MAEENPGGSLQVGRGKAQLLSKCSRALGAAPTPPESQGDQSRALDGSPVEVHRECGLFPVKRTPIMKDGDACRVRG